MSKLTRRRFLLLLGAASCSPSLSSRVYRWHGTALGGAAAMALVGVTESLSKACFLACQNELARLEGIFSLHRPKSIIRNLNTQGVLYDPPSELVEVLNISKTLYERSAGVFDPTIQPLWHYLFYLGSRPPDKYRLNQLQKLIGFNRVFVSPEKIRYADKHMAITLNGIAQGFITDKIVQLLKTFGIQNTLVQLGETYALGHNRIGEPWNIRVPLAKQFEDFRLTNQAIATSEPGKDFEHLLNPGTGESSTKYSSVSVIANSATIADGLSTTLSICERKQHLSLLRSFGLASSSAFLF